MTTSEYSLAYLTTLYQLYTLYEVDCKFKYDHVERIRKNMGRNDSDLF